MLDSQHEPYEPPKVEARGSIDRPLIGLESVGLESAVFRPIAGYEPPKIDRRDQVDVPLVGAVSGPSTAPP